MSELEIWNVVIEIT